MNRFYTGVVEDRMDPIKLGRCRVRVVGIHTELKTILPTEDLPWAMPLQSLNSAAMSGIGQAPLGPVEGTWVVVFFQDEDTQFPIIFGALGGIPQDDGPIEEDTGTLSLNDPNGTVSSDNNTVKVDKNGEVVREGEVTPVEPKKEPTVKDQVVEGSTHGSAKPANQYTTVSKKAIDLIKAGEGLAKKIGNNQVQAYPDPGSGGEPWTIGYGTTRIGGKPVEPGQVITIQQAEQIFQEQIVRDYLPGVKSSIRGLVTQSMIDACVSLAYNIGVGGFRRSSVCSNINRGDYQGAANSFSLFNKASGRVLPGLTKRRAEEAELFLHDGIPNKGTEVKPNDETVKKEAEETNNLQDKPTPPVDSPNQDGSPSSGTSNSASQEFGFRDPNEKYPLYKKEPDTNRLARHEFIEKTVVITKEAAVLKGVETAQSKTWSQAIVPYNADYPFNQVYESEAGHLMEFDSTPGAERIHFYHKAGTYTEIDHNGTQVNRIIGDGFSICERNGHVYIGGSAFVTIKGDSNVLVENALNLDVKGVTKIRVYNDANIQVGGNCKMNVTENFDIKAKNITIEAREEFSIKSGTTTHVQSGTAMHLNAGSTGAFSSASGMNIRSGSTMNVDYTRGNFGQGASSAEEAFDADAGEEIEKEEPQPPELEALVVNSRAARSAVHYETEDDDPAERDAWIKKQIENGAIVPEDQDPNAKPEAEEKPPENKVQPKGASCDVIFGMKTFPASMKLSQYWTVGDLTKAGTRAIVDNSRASAQQIACNLKGLCENCLDPVKKAFPSAIITSGYRRAGDAAGASDKSQHNIGEAADIVIRGFNRQQHYDAILKIQQLIPYDQLLLEYDGTTTVWIHISLKYGGNRKQNFTMNHHRRVGDIGKFVYLPERK
jgi:GH24 family phage-related lysozyme (muramidase)